MTALSALVPAPLRPLARSVREYVRRLVPVTVDRPLDPADANATLNPLDTTYFVPQGGTFTCPVEVGNAGGVPWSSQGRHPIRLVASWLTSRNEPTDVPPQAIPLPCPVYPGRSVWVETRLTAPDAVGHYLIRFTLEQQGLGGGGIISSGGRQALLDAQVVDNAARDIDYKKVYATADLARDHWTVVGPGTRAEFEHLARAKLDHLRDVGFTPDARVLDVGCGTGQLGTALVDVLTDRGCYVGTDIGPEAIAFCAGHFERPNFRFHVNDMTRLPITGEAFDFVTFFSVFTHLYPDESVLLLAEAARLLAPGGVILGDVFVNPRVDRCAGNRGMMELNREHFLRLVGLTGLTAEVYREWVWKGPTSRVIYKYTRPLP